MAIIRPIFNWVAQPGSKAPAAGFIRSTTNASTFNSAGSLIPVTAGVLRDYFDPVTGEYRGKLIEEARTRINTRSANVTIAESVTVTAQAYTLSFYGTGSIVLSGAYSSTVAGSGAFPTRRTFTFTPSAGTLTMTPSGTVQYLQVEAGTFATSVILGEGSPQTRNADSCVVDTAVLQDQGGGGLFSGAAATLYVDFMFSALRTDTASQPAISLDDGTAANRAAVARTATLGIYHTVKSGNTVIGAAQTMTASPTIGTRYRTALAYDVTGRSGCVNGGAIVADSASVSIAFNTYIYLNIGSMATPLYLNGTIRHIALFNRRLSDADIQALTAS